MSSDRCQIVSPAPYGKCTTGQEQAVGSGQGRAGRGLSGLGYASVRRTKEEKKKINGESDAPNATTDNNELRNKRGRERDTEQQWAKKAFHRGQGDGAGRGGEGEGESSSASCAKWICSL